MKSILILAGKNRIGENPGIKRFVCVGSGLIRLQHHFITSDYLIWGVPPILVRCSKVKWDTRPYLVGDIHRIIQVEQACKLLARIGTETSQDAVVSTIAVWNLYTFAKGPKILLKIVKKTNITET
jgi:hypothetical protein